MSGYKRVSFYELCRLCASNEQSIKTHIFHDEGRELMLEKKIEECLSLKVQMHDDLPKVVCSACVDDLGHAYAFRAESAASETMLSSYYRKFRDTPDFTKSGAVYVKERPKFNHPPPSSDVMFVDMRTEFPAPPKSPPISMPSKHLLLRDVVITRRKQQADDGNAQKPPQRCRPEIMTNITVNADGEVINIATPPSSFALDDLIDSSHAEGLPLGVIHSPVTAVATVSSCATNPSSPAEYKQPPITLTTSASTPVTSVTTSAVVKRKPTNKTVSRKRVNPNSGSTTTVLASADKAKVAKIETMTIGHEPASMTVTTNHNGQNVLTINNEQHHFQHPQQHQQQHIILQSTNNNNNVIATVNGSQYFNTVLATTGSANCSSGQECLNVPIGSTIIDTSQLAINGLLHALTASNDEQHKLNIAKTELAAEVPPPMTLTKLSTIDMASLAPSPPPDSLVMDVPALITVERLDDRDPLQIPSATRDRIPIKRNTPGQVKRLTKVNSVANGQKRRTAAKSVAHNAVTKSKNDVDANDAIIGSNGATAETVVPPKIYTCLTCDKTFKRREHLYQHAKLHTGMRPFCCNTCNKTFMRKEHLMRHETAHSGQKDFTCPVCFKSFSRNDNLIKHKKTHERQKLYVCGVCNKSFIMKHYYQAHKLTHPVFCVDEDEGSQHHSDAKKNSSTLKVEESSEEDSKAIASSETNCTEPTDRGFMLNNVDWPPKISLKT